MERIRNFLFIIVIGILIAAAFLSRTPSVPEPVNAVSNQQPTDPPSDDVRDSADQPQAPGSEPTPTRPVAPAVANNPSDGPTPTPESYFAEDIQTPIPNSTVEQVDSAVDGWNPPPQEVPIARHPEDHYWLIRPVGSDNNNFGLAHYPYGSNGPEDNLRIHHGIDIANPIGVEVYAAADGTVIWSGKGHFNEFEQITAYGNTIVIEHDFGYRGKRVYTLYAHLSALLVEKGWKVESGQRIGLIGNTGQVTGPHVHFEVRVERNSYFAVRNPDLWMAPYVGTGVIAGKVVNDKGELMEDVPVTLIDLRSNQVVARTGTYAGFGVTEDNYWQENFTIPDVPTGTYLVTAQFGAITWSAEIEVLPGMTNYVELTRHDSGDADAGQPVDDDDDE